MFVFIVKKGCGYAEPPITFTEKDYELDYSDDLIPFWYAEYIGEYSETSDARMQIWHKMDFGDGLYGYSDRRKAAEHIDPEGRLKIDRAAADEYYELWSECGYYGFYPHEKMGGVWLVRKHLWDLYDQNGGFLSKADLDLIRDGRLVDGI